MVTLTTPLGRITQTLGGETIIIKTNNHGKGTQLKTLQETTKITTSSQLTKIFTENHKTLIPTLTIIHPITTQLTKTPTIIHQHPKTNQSHKTLRGLLI